MFNHVFDFLSRLDAFFWSYIGFAIIAVLGSYFTIKTRFFQIRLFPTIIRTFSEFIRYRASSSRGTHPLKVFFTSVGGMVGVGNIVGIITALQLGGPGAIFWVWIAAFLGSIIKYSEVFLGLKYRVPNEKGGYDGGSIHFLRKAFNVHWIGTLVCILLCIYGAEIYQFSVLTHSISSNWQLDHVVVSLGILSLILYAVIGGIQRVGKICSLLMPAFTLVYIAMCFWVIGHHIPELPGLFVTIFKSAFTGHAGIGGFVGSSILLALQNGIARSVYSADIGIGYDSVIHSETSAEKLVSQARLTIFGVFIDNLVCTCSLLMALCTGLWYAAPQMDSTLVIQKALSFHFPGQEIFLPLFLFVLVYTTLISYLLVGLKCARQLHSKYGEKVYLFLAAAFLFCFSFFDQSKALLVMSLSGCMLLIINLLGIFRLRKEIDFTLPETSKKSERAI
jgi:AGCS family alanine or glycine:cation symporter